MDSSLQTLCRQIKTVFQEINTLQHPISYTLFIGKEQQGKSTILKQSSLKQVSLNTLRPANIFYDNSGIIIELGEAWFSRSDLPIATTIKALNRAYRCMQISSIVLTLDVNELVQTEPSAFIEKSKPHLLLLRQLFQAFNYPIGLFLFFTKLDGIAGFSEYYQSVHASELIAPLGFSIDESESGEQRVKSFKAQFDGFIEMLSQSVIPKLHLARTGVKRTLIREFPIQIASLKPMIQLFVQAISTKQFSLQAIYFMSAEQGGISLDRLNKRIAHEYALVVQDNYPQSKNFKPYFIEGAISNVMDYRKQSIAYQYLPNKWILGTLAASVILGITVISSHYLHTSNTLSHTKEQLELYQQLTQSSSESTKALYHLNQAAFELEQLHPNTISSPQITHLLNALKHNIQVKSRRDFLPKMEALLEQVLKHPNTSYQDRFEALKIYLMMGENTPYQPELISQWFSKFWSSQQMDAKNISINSQILNTVLKTSRPNLKLDINLVQDTRNFLKALPSQYVLLTLAKENFSTLDTKIEIPGFDLAEKTIPVYFTKQGFIKIEASLPNIIKKLGDNNWVLDQTESFYDPEALMNAYSQDYVKWWQQFLKKSSPQSMSNYSEAKTMLDNWQQNHALTKLINLAQKETSPDLLHPTSKFNTQIANQFTDLNLLNTSTIDNVASQTQSLQPIITALMMSSDKEKAAFQFAKNRFMNATLSDQLTTFLTNAATLPEPLAQWNLSVGNQIWTLIMQDTRTYINQVWAREIYPDYKNEIEQRFPFIADANQEVSVNAFNHFFSPNGKMLQFITSTLLPFIDVSTAEWKPKALNGLQLSISEDTMNTLMRANVIKTMFFNSATAPTKIKFSLQKVSLDPMVASLQLALGNQSLTDSQDTESYTEFSWPSEGALLSLNAIDGKKYTLDEKGPWAFFRMLQKINVLVDEEDSTSLQILFEINGNSGRYVLKTQSPINPFIPGILTGFTLDKTIV